MNTKQPQVKNFINGQFARNGEPSMDVVSPLTGAVISNLPMSGMKELNQAVAAAKAAYPAWSGLTLKERVQIFFKYRQLLEQNIQELS
ncbi:MAG: aldehyde dehydrogenase family protein, partial [Bacteroidetes bacterium]|nr:aldehyde dehydrogenase family protein [Bacteroidota bacterium]